MHISIQDIEAESVLVSKKFKGPFDLTAKRLRLN